MIQIVKSDKHEYTHTYTNTNAHTHIQKHETLSAQSTATNWHPDNTAVPTSALNAIKKPIAEIKCTHTHTHTYFAPMITPFTKCSRFAQMFTPYANAQTTPACWRPAKNEAPILALYAGKMPTAGSNGERCAPPKRRRQCASFRWRLLCPCAPLLLQLQSVIVRGQGLCVCVCVCVHVMCVTCSYRTELQGH